jgi:exosortase family protein XrtF
MGILNAKGEKRAFVKFILAAATSYLLLFVVYQFVVKKYSFYDQKFIGHIIESVDSCLKFLGYRTFKVLQDRDMQVVGIDGSSGVWVGSNCNAITLFALFAVFVAAFPGRQKAKIWFIPLGMLAIHILNILRVVSLALIAYYLPPEYLTFNHTYTFTFLVYGFIFLLWIIWVNRFANTGHEAQAS